MRWRSRGLFQSQPRLPQGFASGLATTNMPASNATNPVKPAPFLYHDPQSRADLHDLLARLENTKLLAGGQSLMPMLNMRIVAPDHVIDLNRMPGMTGIAVSDNHVRIGAMTRQADLHRSREIAEHLPIMVEALDHVGHFQTRSRGTIGGSCCHLDPAAELPALCALYEAKFEVSGPTGARMVACRNWFPGLSAIGARRE
jgi:carbon-monoxide dehydrogenase medium subunit